MSNAPVSYAQLRALKAKATRGKWFVVGYPWGDDTYAVAGSPDPHAGAPVLQTIEVMEATETDTRTAEQVWEDKERELRANLELAVGCVNAIDDLLADAERVAAAEARANTVTQALRGLMDGADCAFCDRGVLRKRVDGRPPFHADECPWQRALAELGPGHSTEADDPYCECVAPNGERETEHHLKTWPEPYEALIAGIKPFEWRRDDRDFRVGDTLWLWEVDREKGERTGRYTKREVCYILRGRFGVPDGYCVLGLRTTIHGESEKQG